MYDVMSPEWGCKKVVVKAVVCTGVYVVHVVGVTKTYFELWCAPRSDQTILSWPDVGVASPIFFLPFGSSCYLVYRLSSGIGIVMDWSSCKMVLPLDYVSRYF